MPAQCRPAEILFEPVVSRLQLNGRLVQFRSSPQPQPTESEFHMKSLKTVLIAASLLATGAAFADTAQVNVDNLGQTQSGSRNKQKLEIGVVDMDTPLGTSRAIVNARDIRQTQSGSRNTQEMAIGKSETRRTSSRICAVPAGTMRKKKPPTRTVGGVNELVEQRRTY
jgi:hypothetical protein